MIKCNNAFISTLAILAALDSNLFANLGLRKCSPSFICTTSQGMLWYGMVWNGIWNGRKKSVWNMEWKEKIGMEYGMAEVWNGRFDLWNGTNFPYSIQIPYLHILTWCC